MEQPSKRPKVLQSCHYRVLRGHPILGISSPPFPDTTNFPGLASPSFLNLVLLWSKNSSHQDSQGLQLCPQLNTDLPTLPHLLSNETSNTTVLNIRWDKVSWKKTGISQTPLSTS